MQRRFSANGFTLFELLAVVAVIAILMTLLAPSISNIRDRGRQTDCQSNLRQFGTALIVYRADNQGNNPPWLSNLYPDYIDDKALYICKSDPNRGFGQIKADELPGDEFEMVIDNESNPERLTYDPDVQPNIDIIGNSYFYEWSAALVPDGWGPPGQTWAEYKIAQLMQGDIANDFEPYSTSRFPIIRCFHHHRSQIDGRVRNANGTRGAISDAEPLTYNVAYAGNVFSAPLWWEGRLEPGESD